MDGDGHLHEKSASSFHRERATNAEEEGITLEFDDVETSRVLRKVDWRLLPVLTFLYLLAYLDRSNLGNAKVAGLSDDLELTGGQYNMSATVDSVPSNAVPDLDADRDTGLFLHLLPARGPGKCHAKATEAVAMDWLPRRGLGHSTFEGTPVKADSFADNGLQVTTCTGAVQNYNGLIVVRVMLGVTEAGKPPTTPITHSVIGGRTLTEIRQASSLQQPISSRYGTAASKSRPASESSTPLPPSPAPSPVSSPLPSPKWTVSPVLRDGAGCTLLPTFASLHSSYHEARLISLPQIHPRRAGDCCDGHRRLLAPSEFARNFFLADAARAALHTLAAGARFGNQGREGEYYR